MKDHQPFEASAPRAGVMQNRSLFVVMGKEDFDKLKRDCAYAAAEGFDSFLFMDRELKTSFAKVMIEQINHQMGAE